MNLVETSQGKEWNGFLANGRHSHPFQTAEMANALKEHGFKTRFFALENKGGRKAQIVMLEKTASGSKLIEEISSSWLSYSPPVFSCETREERTVFNALIEGLKEKAKSKGVGWITIWAYPLWDPVELFAKAGFESIERQNVLLEARETPEETFKGFRKDVRRNIRKGRGQDVKTQEVGTLDGMKAFHSIFSAMVKSRKMKPKPWNLFHAYWRELIETGRGKLFLAEKDGKTIAGLLVVLAGNYALSFLNCTRQNAYKYCPQHVLKAAFAEKMPSLGLKYFDLNFAGSMGEDTKAKKVGDFKKGWGETKTFHEFCCAADAIKGPLTESERKITRAALQSGASSISEISEHSKLSEKKAMEAARELWAQGLLPGDSQGRKKIRELLIEGKGTWEIVGSTSRPPREILRSRHYLRKAGVVG